MADTPLIYDLYTDEYRPIRQDEVDELCRIKVAYGHMRMMNQSVLSEAQKMAAGQPHTDADRDMDAYMEGEDTRQRIEREKRLDTAMAKYDHDEDLEACLADLDAHVKRHPFPRYGVSTTRIDTSGAYLDTDPKTVG